MNQPKTLEKRQAPAVTPGLPGAQPIEEEVDFAEVAVRATEALETIAYILERIAIKEKLIEAKDAVYAGPQAGQA